MTARELSLPGLLLLKPTVYGDDRGFFYEMWNARRFQDATGIDTGFVQDNLSRSQRGVLRYLHFQNPHPQGKLVSVVESEVFDVAVDVRLGSPTFGQWEGVRLSAVNKRQLYVPPGCAHGFAVLSDSALFHYKCTDRYAPYVEHTIRWDDPGLAIAWPRAEMRADRSTARPLLSEKDRLAPCLADLPASTLTFAPAPTLAVR